MSKYKLKGINYSDYIDIIRQNFTPRSSYIELSIDNSLNERLFENIYSPIDLPRKEIAFYDGYAVKFEDIKNADVNNPIKLKIVSYIFKDGDEIDVTINNKEAAYITANSPLPMGADTVVRSELARKEGEYIIIRKSIPKGSDIVHKGDDVKKGELILHKGKLIEGQDLTLMTEIGIYRVKVYRRPRIGVYSVGDELKEEIERGGVYPDNYKFIIKYVISEMGGEAHYLGILSDDKEEIVEKVINSIKYYDSILLVGGASIGLNDSTGPAIGTIGKPLFHGTTLSPGKVSGLYLVDEKPVFLVPGHIGSAVSCLYNIFYPYIKYVYYDDIDTLPVVKAKLMEKPDQRPGKHTVRTVSLVNRDGVLYAYPHKKRLGGSTLLTPLTTGAGITLFEPDKEYNVGDTIRVILFTRNSSFKMGGEGG